MGNICEVTRPVEYILQLVFVLNQLMFPIVDCDLVTLNCHYCVWIGVVWGFYHCLPLLQENLIAWLKVLAFCTVSFVRVLLLFLFLFIMHIPCFFLAGCLFVKIYLGGSCFDFSPKKHLDG